MTRIFIPIHEPLQGHFTSGATRLREARGRTFHLPYRPSDASRIAVRVIRAKEELMIARSVTRVLKLTKSLRNPS